MVQNMEMVSCYNGAEKGDGELLIGTASFCTANIDSFQEEFQSSKSNFTHKRARARTYTHTHTQTFNTFHHLTATKSNKPKMDKELQA